MLLLSFGLGAALDRFLLHPLDVPHPETLVRAVERHPPVTSWEWFPYSLYEEMRSMHTLREVAVEGDLGPELLLRDE